jgi:pseudouridine synthase
MICGSEGQRLGIAGGGDAGSAREDRGVSNRLANATSPYLLQHADNPVDWWEWSEEAFDEARRKNVPIFLSIGYSACHWCHVMAHESFENGATAEYLNANFVSIKVDREERPDIDSIYMEATVAMTGHGGWPMSVFLDHEGRPFYTGTYFPPEPRHQMSSFPQLLQAITDAWNERRDEIEAAGQRIIDALSRRQLAEGSAHPPSMAEFDAAVAVLMQDFDPQFGGFGGAPKFPPSMVLEFLIRYATLSGAAHGIEALDMTERTLEAMARGGMYDQLGGGFARYSVDDRWIVPHFEKMLYDNALLLRVYLHFWRLTGSALAERVVRETAEFLVRDLTTPQGGFASALDADSEGLLLFTNDNAFKTRLLDPSNGHMRTYHAQVEGVPSPEQLQRLERPMELRIKGKSFTTRGCKASVIAPSWPERKPPIRERASIPDSWIELALDEGKNRQVRRMTAAVGLPTLRLIRVAMASYSLDNLEPGIWKQLPFPHL